MNKRKPDDEFARIGLSYFNVQGKEVVVDCPETVGADATLNPVKPGVTAEIPDEGESHQPEKPRKYSKPKAKAVATDAETSKSAAIKVEAQEPELKEQHFTITYDATGYSYESIILPYLAGAKSLVIEEPYVRVTHQIQNFVRFCEAVLKQPSVKKINLVIGFDDDTNLQEIAEKLKDVQQSLLEFDVQLDIRPHENLHDREIRIDNGWVIKIGRGLDFYQKPDSWFGVGVNDLSLRRCLETKVDIFKEK